jgi:RNA polymerase sigma-70 factor, ECF subfamily
VIIGKEKKTITLEDFSFLYEKYGPMVLRRCRFLLRNEDNALDAMQDVFVRAIERHTKMTSVCASFFYTIATSVCINKLRAAKIRKGPEYNVLLEEITDNSAALHEDITDAALLLDYIFNGTQDDTRRMATLHYIDGFTLEETAGIMNMSVSGIRKRLSSLRKKALLSISIIVFLFNRNTGRN